MRTGPSGCIARWNFPIDKDLVDRETTRGTIPKALRPIFRDRDDFTAGHTLTEHTLAALDASRALIVICSPSSAKSPYVNEEIRLFKTRHPDRPVIPLIVVGKPGDPELECFPPPLQFKLDAKGRITKRPVEILAADAREEGDGKNLALAKVIAGLLGLSSDDVFRRAERERRAVARRRRRLQALVGVLFAGIVIGLLAWWNQTYLKAQIYWLTSVRPYVLTVEAEQALKPSNIFRECEDCPAMVVIPAGTFTMDSPKSRDGTGWESPQHEVVIARPFAVAKYEVTFAQWETCIAALGCPQVSDGGWGRGERPVTNVVWDEAQQYVTWLSKLTGRPYQLLSEAEWEYAARAERPHLTLSVVIGLCWENLRGTKETPILRRTLLAKRSRTVSVSTTCTAMCGNGCKIAGTTPTRELRPTEPHGPAGTTAGTASLAAVPSAKETSPRPNASIGSPTPGSIILDSESRGRWA